MERVSALRACAVARFTHMCAVNQKGGFLLRRHTIRSRLRQAIQRVRRELLRRRHLPKHDVGIWLGQVVAGYNNYHAVRTNRRALAIFRKEVGKAWYFALKRRSHKDSTTWKTMPSLLDRYLPAFAYKHPWPEERFDARHTQVRSRMR